jgi:hypothetical protein
MRNLQEMILPCLFVGVTTPRAAYEMIRGQSVSNAEWIQYRDPWERNWKECVRLLAAKRPQAVAGPEAAL